MDKDQLLNDLLVIGNAMSDGAGNSPKGWFVGCFIDEKNGLRSTGDLEVKWGVHALGEKRIKMSSGNEATTMTLLIKGLFLLEFPELNCSEILRIPGDYLIFSPGVAHRWEALEDSVVVTIRWPSRVRAATV